MSEIEIPESLEEAIAQALFHDERLWFGFTDAHKDLGGVTQARQEVAIVAADVAKRFMLGDCLACGDAADHEAGPCVGVYRDADGAPMYRGPW